MSAHSTYPTYTDRRRIVRVGERKGKIEREREDKFCVQLPSIIRVFLISPGSLLASSPPSPVSITTHANNLNDM